MLERLLQHIPTSDELKIVPSGYRWCEDYELKQGYIFIAYCLGIFYNILFLRTRKTDKRFIFSKILWLLALAMTMREIETDYLFVYMNKISVGGYSLFSDNFMLNKNVWGNIFYDCSWPYVLHKLFSYIEVPSITVLHKLLFYMEVPSLTSVSCCHIYLCMYIYTLIALILANIVIFPHIYACWLLYAWTEIVTLHNIGGIWSLT